jgi:hypothetical protein
MASLSNPIVELAQAKVAERRKKEEFRFPFKIVCVLGVIEDRDKHNSIRLVRKFCDENKVVFSIREYDSDRFEMDRNHVSRFPAFHLLERTSNDWWLTMYGNENPIGCIQEEILRYRDLERQKRERAAERETQMNRIRSFFTFEGKWFKRKTALPSETASQMTKQRSARLSVQEKVPVELPLEK